MGEEFDDNGHKDETALAKTKKSLDRHSIENAFSMAEFPSAIKMLVEPGEDTLKLSMRTVLPKRKTDGRVLAVAAAHVWAACEEFGDKAGGQELLMLLALSTSIDGGARNDLVDAIIGERRHKAGGGFFDKLKNAAGLGEKQEG